MNGFCSCGHSEDDHEDVDCGDMIWSQKCTKCNCPGYGEMNYAKRDWIMESI